MIDHYTSLPRKRVHTASLIFNQAGELLLLKPTYKKNWSLPGGSVEKDESPKAGCVRETKEETGLTIPDPQFLAVQYIKDPEKGDALFFMFDCGTVSETQIASITLLEEEIAEWKFVPLTAIHEYVTEGIMSRITLAIEAKRSSGRVYSERDVS